MTTSLSSIANHNHGWTNKQTEVQCQTYKREKAGLGSHASAATKPQMFGFFFCRIIVRFKFPANF